MRYIKTDRMYCFSPPVMIATFTIEMLCAMYVILRYKVTVVTRLAAIILVALATFQLAEYNVCEGAWGLNSLMWARVGYVAITILPPVGLHLATRIAQQKQYLLIGIGYASSFIFACIFLFVGHGMESQECLGNYVIFSIASWAVIPYFIYYYGWLMATIAYAWRAGRAMVKRSNKRTALYMLAIGYLAFIMPTTAANLADPATIAGIPSVMCGFAVILALILTGFVIPRYYSSDKEPS